MAWVWLWAGPALAVDWPFEPLTVGSDGHGLAVEDIDGDGDPDVAFVSAEGRVRWIEGATGTIHDVGDVSARDGTDLVAVDADGDGDVDLVSAAVRSASAGWFENLGGGAFLPKPVPIEVPTVGCQLTVTDVDGDGDPDLLFTQADDDDVIVALNFRGRFTASTTVHTGQWPTRAVTGDLDGDGDPDLVIASAGAPSLGVASTPTKDSALTWYANDGGAFGEARLVDELEGAAAAAIGDLDGDGDLDLVAAGLGDRPLRWYANDGAGGFGSAYVVDGIPGSTAGTVVAEDVDDDGDVDLVVGRITRERYPWGYSVLVNEGDGSAFVRVDLTEAATPTRVAVGDVDGDGRTDLVVAELDYPNDAVRWFRRVDHGWFRTELTSVLGGLEAIAIGDLDGDGDLDVAGASAAEERVVWWENVDGAFARLEVVDAERAGWQNDLAAADLDGDGDDDLLSVTSLRDTEVGWYEALGNGVFGPRRTIGTTAAQRVAAVDVDRDGDLDVVTGSSTGVRWYANLGRDGFSDATECSVGKVDEMAVADLDGDGHDDLLTVDAYAKRLSWSRADGDCFGPAEVVGTRHPFHEVTAADLDGDGHVDPVVASEDGVWWYANDGQGGFVEAKLQDEHDFDYVVAIDHDGDGDVDVAAAGLVTTPFVYDNDGHGRFAAPTLVGQFGGSIRLAGADLDGDGDGDLVSGWISGVLWYVEPTFDPVPGGADDDDDGAPVTGLADAIAALPDPARGCGCESGARGATGATALGVALAAGFARRRGRPGSPPANPRAPVR